MIFGVPARVISGAFALGAFAIAIIAGLGAGNPTSVILINAIIAMAVCNVIGLLIGAVMERTVRDHVEHYRAMNPLPELDGTGSGAPDDPDINVDIVEEEVDNSTTG